MSLCQEIINIDCKFNELVALANMAADLVFDDDDIPQLTMREYLSPAMTYKSLGV